MRMDLPLILIRAGKTYLQTFLALLGLDQAPKVEVPTRAVFMGAIFAALLSALMNAFSDVEAFYVRKRGGG